jgi:hypothetical protein
LNADGLKKEATMRTQRNYFLLLAAALLGILLIAGSPAAQV